MWIADGDEFQSSVFGDGAYTRLEHQVIPDEDHVVEGWAIDWGVTHR
jgi:hypothetical protein